MGHEIRWLLYGKLENDKEAITLSFKLEFPCSNNTSEYEAYLKELATTLEIGIKHLRLICDSKLEVYQAK